MYCFISLIEIPDDVESWTYGKIVDLVNEGYDENEILEFKKEINSESKRLCQAVCAFANTEGGTVIFGIDNNRTTPLHLHDRIIGLDDSDQLKRNIIDKIKNIKPNVPIQNTVFRKTNIKLPNKKVLVILNILPSESAPHQYENIFYKRVAGGNEPMSVDEIKYSILESQKNKNHLILMLAELSLIKSTLESAQELILQKHLVTIPNLVNEFDLTSSRHFLYEQAHLYTLDLMPSLGMMIHNITRLTESATLFSDVLTGGSADSYQQLAKKDGYEDPMQYITDILSTRIQGALDEMVNLEKMLNVEIPDTIKMELKKSNKS